MADIKEDFILRLQEITNHFILNIKERGMSADDAYMFILGATKNDVNVICEKITNALPDYFFQSGVIGEEIKEEIVKNLVLFMSQENIKDETFDRNFVNHIYDNMRDIREKFKFLSRSNKL